MSLNEEELQQEERKLNDVLSLIEEEINRADRAAGGRKEQLIGGKRELWDDLVYDTDDWFEAAVQLTQQAQELSQHARSYRLAQGRREHLERLQSSPYFGRFDFKEDGLAQTETLYLGTMSLADEETHEVVIYDWRAPIAGMYYDFGPGPASYEAPSGKVRGELTLKRQFVIRGGKLLSAFDTGVTIGDEMLQRMLGKGTDDKMKSIVTTIQREQNRIIRETSRKYVFVQGAAGSGKTSAALQRIAYLLYRYRKSWDPEQLVLFSPNDVFNDYVSNVLPELGEDSIPQTTFYDYVWRRLRHVRDVEHPYDQLEFLYSLVRADADEVRLEGIRLKASLAFTERIDAYAKTLSERGVRFQPLIRREKTVISARELEELFYGDLAPQRLPVRLASMKEKLNERLAKLERGRAVALYRKWIKEPKYLGTEQELKRLSVAKAKKAYEPLRAQVAAFGFLDIVGTYQHMFAALAEDPGGLPISKAAWGRIADDTDGRLNEEGVLPYEDAVPMLYLLEALHGASRLNRVRHVIVDEAQDYTPLQWSYLRRLFPNAGFTAVGDRRQAIHGLPSEVDHMEIAAIFPPEETLEVRLTKSYRSTKQIVAFSGAMLPEGDAIEPFEREGPKPEVVQFDADIPMEAYAARIRDRVQAFQDDGFSSVAVVAKTAAQSEEAFRRLKASGLQATRLTKDTVTFPAGPVILPSYLSKGLEFDAVLIWDASENAYSQEGERKLFYTVCTRALHRLSLYSPGPLSPFVTELPSNLYTLS